MNLKASISILISAAYFLTLFIFNMLKNPNILHNIKQSTIYSIILFVFLYTLLYYIEFAINESKKKESQKALQKIKDLELENYKIRKEKIDMRLSEIDKEILSRDKENVESISQSTERNKTEEQVIQMKKDSGTQFDSNFSTNNISI